MVLFMRRGIPARCMQVYTSYPELPKSVEKKGGLERFHLWRSRLRAPKVRRRPSPGQRPEKPGWNRIKPCKGASNQAIELPFQG
jgi:hypothetical protein